MPTPVTVPAPVVETLPDDVPYKEAFIKAGKTCPGISARLLAAQARQESNFDPKAVGPMTQWGTAKGMSQFIDTTWAQWGHGSPFDPQQAIAAQGRFMCALYAKLGSSTLALAAYNAGPNAVKKYKGIPPYDQTINYVQRIERQL